MKMEWVREFKDPGYTASFQRSCGIVSYGKVVTNNNNNGSKDSVEKLGPKGLNGVKNGYHLHEDKQRSFPNQGNRNGYISDSDYSSQCKHKVLTTQDGVQYSILNLPLYYIFRIGALMGNEEFFLSFFPFVLWNIDVEIARKTILVWALSMYMGQAAKDIVLWPRPASPPVVRLETVHNGEHGMPSTHAIAGTVIPTTFFLLVYHRYEISPYVCVWLAVSWALLVCLSRLYLGVHSVSDVLCGAGGSLFFMASFLPYLGACDHYLETHVTAAFVVFTIGLALCTIFYPSTKTASSKANAGQVVMATAGLFVGFWAQYTFGSYSSRVQTVDRMLLAAPTLEWATLSVMRFLLGAVMIVATHSLVGKSAVRLLSYLRGLPGPQKKHPSVIIPYTVITYSVVGFAIGVATPYLQAFPGGWTSVILERVL